MFQKKSFFLSSVMNKGICIEIFILKIFFSIFMAISLRFQRNHQPWFSCFLAVSEKSTNQHAAPPLKARSRILKKRWQLIAYVFKVSWKFLIWTIYNFTVIFTHEICYFLKITLYFNSLTVFCDFKQKIMDQ